MRWRITVGWTSKQSGRKSAITRVEADTIADVFDSEETDGPLEQLADKIKGTVKAEDITRLSFEVRRI